MARELAAALHVSHQAVSQAATRGEQAAVRWSRVWQVAVIANPHEWGAMCDTGNRTEVGLARGASAKVRPVMTVRVEFS